MKILIRPANILMFAGFLSFQLQAQSTTEELDSWAYDNIHIPVSTSVSDQQDPIIVAVVDDAFRLSHNELQGFVFRNPLEIPGNQLDDDGNNYIDDVYGWDISDNDNDVSVPEGKSKVYYHGTYVSSLITRVALLHYGEGASKRVKIMPVKVLSNRANRTYIKDGYKGIRYAMDNGADIICLAWSGGNPGDEDLAIIREAHERGILILGSAGNFNEERILYPASDPSVLAIAGLNKNLGKEEHSNYGMQVDIAAPAEHVMGAHPEKDNAYIHDNGTSASAALVSGCAAILLSKREGLQNSDVREALLNASTPFNVDFRTYGGKMGAGMVNLENALDYLANVQDRDNYFSSLRSKGSISIKAESSAPFWDIKPAGGYFGFYLEPDVTNIKKPEKHSFSIFVNDTVWNEYNLSKIPSQLFVPSASLRVDMNNTSLRKKDVFKINFHGKTVDSTRLYCSETRYLDLESGSIDDGSGDNNYTNNCSCRWIITVPMGKRIKFTFDQMDTQANVDFVYLVDGKTAIPENFIAKFSGQNIPPVVVSRGNEVLVWFVTDKTTTGQGWRLHYEVYE
jgi:hypothetical protein